MIVEAKPDEVNARAYERGKTAKFAKRTGCTDCLSRLLLPRQPAPDDPFKKVCMVNGTATVLWVSMISI